MSATSTESLIADRTSASFRVTLIHLKEKLSIGQASIFEALKAYRKMTIIGMNRKSRTRATQARSAIRVSVSLKRSQRLEGTEPFGSEQVDGHDPDRDHRQGGREGHVVGDADVAVDDVADEACAPTDQDRR